MLNASIRTALRDHKGENGLLSQDGQILSFARLSETITSLTATLSHQGIGPNQNVVALVDNIALRVCLWFAILRRGANVVLVDKLSNLPETGFAVDHVIALPGQDVATGAKFHTFSADWLTPAREDAEPADVSGSQIIYGSSGSTGFPKFMQTPADTVCATAQVLNAVRPDLRHPALICFPTTTYTALVSIISCLVQGYGVTFPMGSTEATLQAARDFGVAALGGSPQNLMDVVRAVDSGCASPDFSSVSYTGAAMEQAELLHAFLTFGTPIRVVAGTSETGPFAMGAFEGEEVPLGWAGSLLPHVKWRLLPVEGNIADLPVGAGRLAILVPEPLRLKGYLGNRPIYDAEGWFNSGDIVTVSHAGEICFHGRSDFLINIGGSKLSPERIERFVLELPDVRDVAAVPLPGNGADSFGLVIVPCGDFNRVKICDALAELSLHVREDNVRVVSELPTLASGKLDRHALRTAWADG